MADLLITRLSLGIAKVRSADPFDSLEIFRIERSHWKETPQTAGVYLLYGQAPDGALTVYVGMSTTNMRNRIRSHHVDKKKNWFGVLFSVPITNSLICPAIEAELIGQVVEAGVVDVIDNTLSEKRKRDIDDPQLQPAVDKITDALELIMGSDIFTPPEDEEKTEIDEPITKMPFLARVYRNQAEEKRPRNDEDPPEAGHAWVGAGLLAWGDFEATEPDKRFRVLEGSQWRRPVLNKDAKTYNRQVKVAGMQEQLLEQGVLDANTMKFSRDHVFDNWALATKVVGGKDSYSGGYHWQRLA